MNAELISDLCVLMCASVGFGYGVMVFLATRAPLYAKMITGAVGCSMLGRLLVVVRDLVGFAGDGFQLNMLSVVGVFMFLLTANAGLMDGLADDGAKKFTKYRAFSLAAPVGIILLDIPIWQSPVPFATRVSFVVVSLVVAAASYFNLKHAVFPDVEFGVIRCVQNYNLSALAYAYVHMAEMVALSYDAGAAVVATGLLTGLVSILIPIMLKKGIDQWQI